MMNIKILILAIPISSLSVACAPFDIYPYSKGRKTYTVELEVVDSGGQPSLGFFTKPRTNDCGDVQDTNGCVKIKKGHSGDIYFKLKGNPHCSGSEKWKLDGVQIAGEDENAKPSDADWDNPKPLSDRAVEDFNADRDSGMVGFATESNGSIRIHSKNRTTLPKGAKEAESYWVWYRVRASCPDSSVAPIFSDPRFRNTGNR